MKGVRNNKGIINIKLLAKKIKDRIQSRSINQKVASNEIGISSSMLSRVVTNEWTPDYTSILKICEWLNIHIDVITNQPKRDKIIVDNKDTMGSITKLIKKDPTLTQQAKEGLIELMDVAYRRFIQVQ